MEFHTETDRHTYIQTGWLIPDQIPRALACLQFFLFSWLDLDRSSAATHQPVVCPRNKKKLAPIFGGRVTPATCYPTEIGIKKSPKEQTNFSPFAEPRKRPLFNDNPYSAPVSGYASEYPAHAPSAWMYGEALPACPIVKKYHKHTPTLQPFLSAVQSRRVFVRDHIITTTALSKH